MIVNANQRNGEYTCSHICHQNISIRTRDWSRWANRRKRCAHKKKRTKEASGTQQTKLGGAFCCWCQTTNHAVDCFLAMGHTENGIPRMVQYGGESNDRVEQTCQRSATAMNWPKKATFQNMEHPSKLFIDESSMTTDESGGWGKMFPQRSTLEQTRWLNDQEADRHFLNIRNGFRSKRTVLCHTDTRSHKVDAKGQTVKLTFVKTIEEFFSPFDLIIAVQQFGCCRFCDRPCKRHTHTHLMVARALKHTHARGWIAVCLCENGKDEGRKREITVELSANERSAPSAKWEERGGPDLVFSFLLFFCCCFFCFFSSSPYTTATTAAVVTVLGRVRARARLH